MLIERSEMATTEAQGDAFAATLADKAVPLLKALPGVKMVTLGRGLEHPEKFMLLVEWDKMDDHIAFTKNPRYPELLAIIQPFAISGVMEHFNVD